MVKAKIVIIGSTHPAALELVFQKSFIRDNFITSIFPAQTLFLQYYNHSFFNKILFRLRLTDIIGSIQIKMKQFIVEESPSIVIVFKGMELKPETIIWIKERGIIICNYNPDHPFVFSSVGSGNKFVRKSLHLFDFYFSYAVDAVNHLRESKVNSYLIPFGFDSDGFVFTNLKKSDEILKVCFLGNGDKFRAKFLNQLAKLGLEIDVYGENWSRFKMDSLIQVGQAKYGKEFWTTLQVYAVQLNLLRPHNLNTHNMRSFDIPGAGGIMLAPKTMDHQTFFKDGTEIFLFDNVQMAYNRASDILNLTFDERLRIRENVRVKSLKFHTYNQRVKKLIDILEI
jgi:hypothetical protein